MDIRNNRLNTVATVLARILEIAHWVGAALALVGTVVYCINEDWLRFFVGLEPNGEFSVSGYTINVWDESGALVPARFIPAMLAGVIALALTAMIFRNIYLIFKTSAGKTKFSKGATPFQKDNVRMLREIGIFAIAIPVVELLFDFGIHLATWSHELESDVSFNGVMLGIAMLCLSQFFAYGVQLQADHDGLL